MTWEHSFEVLKRLFLVPDTPTANTVGSNLFFFSANAWKQFLRVGSQTTVISGSLCDPFLHVYGVYVHDHPSPD